MTSNGESLPEWDPQLRDRVRRLVRVLRTIAAAKTRPTRHTSSCHGVQWLAGAAEHLTVTPATEPGHEVLRAPRVVREPPPESPAELRGWVDYRPLSLTEPELRDHGPAPDGSIVGVDEAPSQRGRFERWLREWRVWAEAEGVRRARGAVHNELFRMHRLALDRPESVEIVLAAGLLHLPDPDTGGVHIHLVNQLVDLTRDVATGDMVVTITEAPPRLEDDEILAGDPVFDGAGGPMLRERLDELVSGAVDPALTDFLKEWAGRAINVACEVSESWEEPSGRRAELRAAPAVVARPRSGFALRSYFDTIITSLEDDTTPVPLGLAQLVEPLENDVRLAWLDRSGKTAGTDLADDPLFPLPANPAQRRIIDRMGVDSGVVVEGPPGTGKTHTIANLVSSLLAAGQRVLVTSQKAQALKVLRDKLPGDMQDLCISMTDASSRGDSDLARSVTRIATKKTSFQPDRARRRITDLTERRRKLRLERERLLSEIQALREAETVVHPEVAPGFHGTVAGIARALVERQGDGWIIDDVDGAAPPPVEETTELLRLLRDEDDDRRSRRNQRLPELASLPAPQQLGGLAETMARGERAVSGEDGDLVSVVEQLPDAALHGLEPASRRAADVLAELDALPEYASWAAATADELLGGRRAHVWQRAVDQLSVVEAADVADRAAGNADVHVDLRTAPAPDAASLEAYAAEVDAKGPRRFLKGQEQKRVESYGDRLLVNGAPVASASAARVAAAHLRVIEAAGQIDRAFGPLGTSIAWSDYRTELVDAMTALDRACRAVGAVQNSHRELNATLSALPPASRPRLAGLSDMHRLARAALAVTEARQARIARHELEMAAEQLEGGSIGRAPEQDELIAAWHAANAGRYRAAVDATARAHAQQAEQVRCDGLFDRLRGRAPRLADQLRAEPHASSWDEWLPRLPEAWARARAAAWMARHQAPGRERELDRELAVATHDLAQVTAELAGEQAWASCLEGMSTPQMQALQIYRDQASKVGKGTGKFAEKYRQAARAAMVEAQRAVPAWIMPIQQVLAAVPPEQDVFDVVIVDEASQAELTSSFLLWLAPRMIVVGDDKQCTPAEVTQGALAPIFDRLDNELPDLPLHRRNQFTSRSSVFDLLRSCFPQVIRLQEHFRCMPEIIEWSSAEFYADAPLIPLRQFGADRLTPLRSTYVPDTRLHGTGQKIANAREAQVIADLVVRCAEDPQYDGRTFGVVVLQGHGQVDLIENLLRERLSDEQWERRRMRVGTPPDFQGDERNVIWLSMVLAPGHRTTALTLDMYRQRFNVAASRAQDQLWLVHSVPADQLAATDMRRLLLDYMTAAQESPLTAMPRGVGRDERSVGFDTLLEQKVFSDLAEGGHHVTPQFEINGRRLDLVVTGPAGRMAVECDADTYPASAEERRDELDREQELKRAGWAFSRVRESSYVLDRPGVRARLDAELSDAGITPLLAGGTTPVPARIADRAPEAPPDEAPPELGPELAEPEPTRPATTSAADDVAAKNEPPAPENPADAASPPETPAPTDTSGTSPVDGLTTDQVRAYVVDLVGQHGTLSAPDLAEEIRVPKMEARGLLTDLSVAGRLVRDGDRRDPVFRLPDRREPSPKGPPDPGSRITGRTGSPSSDARHAQLRRIANELRTLGAVEPARDQEVYDPDRDGALLCIAELFWADGIRGDGAKSVVLELDPEEADLPRLAELRCRVFTSIDELRRIMTAEMSGSIGPTMRR